MADMADQAPVPDGRPLRGEPISVDLLNTVWIDGAGRHDLLTDLPGLRTWLHEHRLEQATVDEATRAALVHTREALRTHTSHPGDAAAAAALNAVLAHGALVRTLDAHGPGTRITIEDSTYLPAWTAVEDYLQLLARGPQRLRGCGNPECVLHFYDTSKRGDRRWCSMAGCGNRAKAARHYARTRLPPPREGGLSTQRLWHR